MKAAIGWSLVGLCLGLFYAAECLFWPFKTCPKCKGTGRRQSPDGKAFGLCRRCKGSARRLRLGRWVFNVLNKFRKSRR
jgi:hypothetical protein